MNPVAPVPSRKGAAGAASTITRTATFGSSTLDQATAAYGVESESLPSFDRMQKRGRKAELSHKAKQRKMNGAEKEEAYAERLGGKYMKNNRRKERMDRLKKIY